jgi:hypothetical protein
MVKGMIVATALAATAFSSAGAQERIAKKYLDSADLAAIVREAPGAEMTIRLAMGPVSAPHLPSGPVNGPAESSPGAGCTAATVSCPTVHKKVKHPRKHISWL